MINEHDFAIQSKKVLSQRNYFYYIITFTTCTHRMQSENDRLIGIRDRQSVPLCNPSTPLIILLI